MLVVPTRKVRGSMPRQIHSTLSVFKLTLRSNARGVCKDHSFPGTRSALTKPREWPFPFKMGGVLLAFVALSVRLVPPGSTRSTALLCRRVCPSRGSRLLAVRYRYLWTSAVSRVLHLAASLLCIFRVASVGRDAGSSKYRGGCVVRLGVRSDVVCFNEARRRLPVFCSASRPDARSICGCLENLRACTGGEYG